MRVTLVGGFKTVEKSARQIGSFPQGENKECLKPPSKIYLSTWQFCWCPFWDGEKVTLSKANRDLQLGDKKVTA